MQQQQEASEFEIKRAFETKRAVLSFGFALLPEGTTTQRRCSIHESMRVLAVLAIIHGATAATARTRMRFSEGGAISFEEGWDCPERHSFTFAAFGTKFALEVPMTLNVCGKESQPKATQSSQ